MTDTEKAIQEFEDNAYHSSMKLEISEKSKAIALSALHEKAEREKGCEYCKENKPLISNAGGLICINSHGELEADPYDDTYFQHRKVNFCPICGYDLRKGETDG